MGFTHWALAAIRFRRDRFIDLPHSINKLIIGLHHSMPMSRIEVQGKTECGPLTIFKSEADTRSTSSIEVVSQATMFASSV